MNRMRKHKWVLGLGLIVFLLWGSLLVEGQLRSTKHACAFESLWITVSDRRVPAPDRKHFEKLSKIASKRIELFFFNENTDYVKTMKAKVQ